LTAQAGPPLRRYRSNEAASFDLSEEARRCALRGWTRATPTAMPVQIRIVERQARQIRTVYMELKTQCVHCCGAAAEGGSGLIPPIAGAQT
jgi:hypothetical protein